MTTVFLNNQNIFNVFGFYIKDYDVGAPSLKMETQKVPFGSGFLDFTEAVGYPTYTSRRISINFKIIEERREIMKKYTEFCNKYHGRKVNIKFGDDINYYYEGRAEVGEIKHDRFSSSFVLTAECQPFKLKYIDTEVTANVNTSAYTKIPIENATKPVCPTIISKSGNVKEISVKKDGKEFTFKLPMQNPAPELFFKEGRQGLEVKSLLGIGQITIVYREGLL